MLTYYLTITNHLLIYLTNWARTPPTGMCRPPNYYLILRHKETAFAAEDKTSSNQGIVVIMELLQDGLTGAENQQSEDEP